jgi:hypothetical protein
MPLPFIAEDVELPDCGQGRGRVEVGEPDGSLEKRDRAIGVSALHLHAGGSDERCRVVGVLERSPNEIVGVRNSVIRCQTGDLRKSRVRPTVSAVVLDDLGEITVFRFQISSAPLHFGKAEQLFHGTRIDRNFWHQKRGFRSAGRGVRGNWRRRRCERHRLPEARPRGGSAEQHEDAKNRCGRGNFEIPLGSNGHLPPIGAKSPRLKAKRR